MDGFRQSFFNTIKSIVYFLIPSAAGLIAVRFQLVDFLYGWGRVTADNVSIAGDILAFYAVGVIGIGIKEVSDRAFFSLKDTKRPAIGGVVVMAVNVAASLLLISYIGVLGIPLAYSISALFGAALLIFMINKKIGYIKEMNLLPNTFKVIAASVIMLVALTPLTAFLNSAVPGQAVLHKGIRLFIPITAGVAVFFVMTYIMKVDETVKAAQKIVDIIKRNKE